MVDLKRIISVIQIESVRLREAQFRSAVQPSEIADAITVTTSRKTEVVQKPTADQTLRIETAFTMEVRSAGEDEELQAEIRGTFELSYEIPDDETFSSEELEAFGEVNAVFNAWPYWRELVQASLARMSMPPLTVPVFRVAPPDTDEAEDDGNE
ncbi:MAG: hypothetical protein OXH04_07075 [Acidobacteria bacterium]|nr:hypothetical protein [Acidobacteriota bacterium]